MQERVGRLVALDSLEVDRNLGALLAGLRSDDANASHLCEPRRPSRERERLRERHPVTKREGVRLQDLSGDEDLIGVRDVEDVARADRAVRGVVTLEQLLQTQRFGLADRSVFAAGVRTPRRTRPRAPCGSDEASCPPCRS